MGRLDIEFKSKGTTCRAWHFRPATADRSLPCIVMAHGFGLTRDCGLIPYAERFAAEGFHALIFDYRHFGASDGKPRLLLSVGRQLADWLAAIEAARKLEGVDPDRIATWGSSFSGGHALVAAAKDGRVAAVSSQGPMMDGWAAFLASIRQAGFVNALGLTGLALGDTIAGLFGGSLRATVAGEPGNLAMLSTPDTLPGYKSIVPSDWPNKVCARVALQTAFYRPVRWAKKVTCPILLHICENDAITPVAPVHEVAKLAKGPVEVHRLAIEHFDIYLGEPFETALANQIDFFRRHLLGG